MMQDAVATFYGGYDRARFIRTSRVRIPVGAVAIGLAAVVLLAFVAADVTAYHNATTPVVVTSVEWYAMGQLLTTSAGFTLHISQTFPLTLACYSLCYRFNSVTVGAPFQVTSSHIVWQPVEYVNATVQAPATGYNGPLIVYLGVGM